MNGRSIIRINNVTCRAATGAVVASVVVCPEEIQGVIEVSLVQAHENGISTILGAEAPFAESAARPAWLLGAIGDANFRPKAAALFEYSEHVPWLARFKPWQGIEERHDPFFAL